MTDSMWGKISAVEKRLVELELEKYEALGRLLGAVDSMALVERYPDVYDIKLALERLYEARRNYDRASAAYVDARLTAAAK